MTKKETDVDINVNGGRVKIGYKALFGLLIFIAVAATGWGVAGHRLSSLEAETAEQGAKIEALQGAVIKIETQYDTIIRTLQRIEKQKARRR
jgi:uncharacterized coiled-coil protein SlyX